MSNVLILLLIILIVFCNPSVTSSSQKIDRARSSIQRTSTIIPLPRVKDFSLADVWRESSVKDARGFDLPPFNKVNIRVGFDIKPVVGEKVTVVPLEVDIAPIELKILKAAKREYSCGETLSHYWAVELEPIRQREFFEVSATPNRREDAPFDVCVIYPTVKFARQIRREHLRKEMIPKGITIRTVTAAIDLTNDNKPDILIASYCCKDFRKLPEECDYTCGKVFKKANRAWKLVEKFSPC